MNFNGGKEGITRKKPACDIERFRTRRIASSRARLCSRYIARRLSFSVSRGVSRIFLLSLFRGRWLREVRVPRFDKTQGLGRCRSLSSILSCLSRRRSWLSTFSWSCVWCTRRQSLHAISPRKRFTTSLSLPLPYLRFT